MKRKTWLACIILQAGLVGGLSPRISRANAGAERLSTQHFFCNTGYELNACHEQIAALKTVVAKFPTEALGPWTWVLVRSQDWKQLTKMLEISSYEYVREARTLAASQAHFRRSRSRVVRNCGQNKEFQPADEHWRLFNDSANFQVHPMWDPRL
jgi:hypothetical protein